MKLRNIFTAIIIASAACLVSCNNMMDKAVQKMIESTVNHDYQDSEKWGKVVTIDLPSMSFDEVELSGAVRLEYTQDSIYSLQVYGNEKAIDAYAISSEDGELEASLKDDNGKVNSNTPAITLRVTAPFLTEIQSMGASEVVFMDSVVLDEELEVSVAGVGKIHFGKLKAEELDVTVSGAGNVFMDDVNCTKEAKFSLSGATSIDGKIACNKLKLKMSGAGNGTLGIHCQQARVTASGAANITLGGECNDFEYSASGSSSVNKEGLKIGGQ